MVKKGFLKNSRTWLWLQNIFKMYSILFYFFFKKLFNDFLVLKNILKNPQF